MALVYREPMPTILTHAIVGLGLTELAPLPAKPPWLWVVAAVMAALPDLDVIGLPLGVPYRSFFGHRGFVHSLACSVVLGFVLGCALQAPLATPWWQLGAFLCIVMASHGVLDGFTNGGLGIAYFAPFNNARYFFPWQPIQVSPIGVAFFSKWGLLVLRSEMTWVWLPLAAIVGVDLVWRRYS